MIVIVEVAIDFLDVFCCFLDLWNPRLQFFFAVSVVKPDVFSSAMPPKIRKISRQMHFRRQKRLIYNRVSNPILLKEAEKSLLMEVTMLGF